MDICVEQADLARALRLVGRAVPIRPTSPALAGILLEATLGRLTLSATDLALTRWRRSRPMWPGRGVRCSRLRQESDEGWREQPRSDNVTAFAVA